MYIQKHFKKRLAVSLISLVVITLTLMASTYALFMDYEYNVEDQIIQVGDLQVAFREGTSAISLVNIRPLADAQGMSQSNNIYKFTIDNTGDLAYHYSINLINNPSVNITNPLSHEWIRYSLNGESAQSLKNAPNGKIFEGVLNSKDDITFELQIWIGSGNATDPTIGLPNEVLGGQIALDVVVDGKAGEEEKTPFSQIILANSNIITPDYNETITNENTATQGGVFYAEDGSLVFRGSHVTLNNNLIWAGYQWKILRVEANGSIRLLYNGKCTLNETQTNCTEGINGGGAGALASLPAGDGYNATVEFNASNDHNRFIGYMYGDAAGTFAEQHINTNNSTIKNRIEAWFNNDANITPAARAQTVPLAFCIDRRINKDATYVGNGLNKEVTQYARGRIYVPVNVIPDLACRVEDKLILNAGLITVDEVLVAGLTSTSANNYSETNANVFVMSGANYWTMTPYSFYSSVANVFSVFSAGNLSSNSVNNLDGVRPVLALRSDVGILNGTGSIDAPFVIQT